MDEAINEVEDKLQKQAQIREKKVSNDRLRSWNNGKQ